MNSEGGEGLTRRRHVSSRPGGGAPATLCVRVPICDLVCFIHTPPCSDCAARVDAYSVSPLERIWFYSCGDVVGELELVRLDGCGEGASQLLWRINGLTG